MSVREDFFESIKCEGKQELLDELHKKVMPFVLKIFWTLSNQYNGRKWFEAFERVYRKGCGPWSFPFSGKIQIGGKTLELVLDEVLTRKEYFNRRIVELIRKNQDQFSLNTNLKNYYWGIFKLSEFGINKKVSLNKIWEAAKGRNLAFCPIDLGLKLNTTGSCKESAYVAMKPIRDSNNKKIWILSVPSEDGPCRGELSIKYMEDIDESVFYPYDKFIFTNPNFPEL